MRSGSRSTQGWQANKGWRANKGPGRSAAWRLVIAACVLACTVELAASSESHALPSTARPGVHHEPDAASPRARAPGPVRHVFLIVLENQSFGAAFGPGSRAPYLARTLTRQGVLLRHYYAIGHNSLDNYIALVSGQAPNEDTQTDCWRYTEFRLAQPALDAEGQALGHGCLYPKLVKTLPDQLEAAHLSWRGYMEDMGKDPARESRTCGRPALQSAGSLQLATPADQYAVKHDPFVYFHSIIDDRARCDAHVVPLDALPHDLAASSTTPNYVFITPNLCHDGHDAPCANGEPGGLVSADAFLRKWVPRITGSPAFRRDGLLILTFDESGIDGLAMAAACCDEQALPGARFPPGILGPGGGLVGALLISPFLPQGTTSDVPYNHYSLLRSVEKIFGLDPLGYAADPRLRTIGADLLTHPALGRADW